MNMEQAIGGEQLAKTVAAQLWPTDLQQWIRRCLRDGRAGEGGEIIYLLGPSPAACAALRLATAELAIIDQRHIMLGDEKDLVVDGTRVCFMPPMIWELAYLGGARVNRDSFPAPVNCLDDLATFARESGCL